MHLGVFLIFRPVKMLSQSFSNNMNTSLMLGCISITRITLCLSFTSSVAGLGNQFKQMPKAWLPKFFIPVWFIRKMHRQRRRWWREVLHNRAGAVVMVWTNWWSRHCCWRDAGSSVRWSWCTQHRLLSVYWKKVEKTFSLGEKLETPQSAGWVFKKL